MFKRIKEKFLSRFTKSFLPYWCILLGDLFVILLAWVSAFCFINGGVAFLQHWRGLFFNFCICEIFMIGGMRMMHTYSGILRYSSFDDLMRVFYALTIGFSLSSIFFTFHLPYATFENYKWGIIGGAFFLSLIGMVYIRILIKYLYDNYSKSPNTSRAFIYGTRDGGIGLAKNIRQEHPSIYSVKGFLSSDSTINNRYLLGVKVYPVDSDSIEIMKSRNIQNLIVSPLCTNELVNNQKFVDQLIKANIKILITPHSEHWDGKSPLSSSMLRSIRVEELLPRDEIKIDLDKIGRMLSQRRILITGAAGSIGSELVYQIAKYNPSELILIDQAETPMHELLLCLEEKFKHVKAHIFVTSITNKSQMEDIFRKYTPEYVFHAAAYKHVPMMEINPISAVQNNCRGTRILADLAVKYGVIKFVMISTDKAVNPSNVMGCSKRICEIYVQALNEEVLNLKKWDGSPAQTQFITTRFGNVLGSNGSVIPLFTKQILEGGPVTVTHPDIIRFFMLISEACELVLEAGTIGNGGEIFVFDMGKPVRIADLAQRMIDLSGRKDVKIKFTGIREGEKLYEEVLSDKETTLSTFHPKIRIASVRKQVYEKALADEERLYQVSLNNDNRAVVKVMKEMVPEFKSLNSEYEELDK